MLKLSGSADARVHVSWKHPPYVVLIVPAFDTQCVVDLIEKHFRLIYREALGSGVDKQKKSSVLVLMHPSIFSSSSTGYVETTHNLSFLFFSGFVHVRRTGFKGVEAGTPSRLRQGQGIRNEERYLRDALLPLVGEKCIPRIFHRSKKKQFTVREGGMWNISNKKKKRVPLCIFLVFLLLGMTITDWEIS